MPAPDEAPKSLREHLTVVLVGDLAVVVRFPDQQVLEAQRVDDCLDLDRTPGRHDRLVAPGEYLLLPVRRQYCAFAVVCRYLDDHAAGNTDRRLGIVVRMHLHVGLRLVGIQRDLERSPVRPQEVAGGARDVHGLHQPVVGLDGSLDRLLLLGRRRQGGGKGLPVEPCQDTAEHGGEHTGILAGLDRG